MGDTQLMAHMRVRAGQPQEAAQTCPTAWRDEAAAEATHCPRSFLPVLQSAMQPELQQICGWLRKQRPYIKP